MFIPRASPTLAPTARLCLLLLLSPRVFRAVAFSFVFYYFSLWVGVFFGRVLLLTKKLRTLRAQLPRVKLIVYSRCCPNCPNHPHLELPPPLLRALFNLRAAPHFSRASMWVDASSWAPACGFWGLICWWTWLQLPCPLAVFGPMGMCPIREGTLCSWPAFPERTASQCCTLVLQGTHF